VHGGGTLVTLLIIGIYAEVLGFLVAAVLAKWNFSLSFRPSLPAFLAFTLILAAATATALVNEPKVANLAYWACPAMFIVLGFTMADLRRSVFSRST